MRQEIPQSGTENVQTCHIDFICLYVFSGEDSIPVLLIISTNGIKNKPNSLCNIQIIHIHRKEIQANKRWQKYDKKEPREGVK